MIWTRSGNPDWWVAMALATLARAQHRLGAQYEVARIVAQLDEVMPAVADDQDALAFKAELDAELRK